MDKFVVSALAPHCSAEALTTNKGGESLLYLRLALIGGEEFADGFEDVHASLLADLGPGQQQVVFLPTCAADDGDETIDYWCATARERLSAIGAVVETPRVVDRASANDPRNAQLVAEADWIYLGGGYPHVAMRILPQTRVPEALQIALDRGALISGASGGAMLMCARSFVVTPELAAQVGEAWESGSPADWDQRRVMPKGLCAETLFERPRAVYPISSLETGSPLTAPPLSDLLECVSEKQALVGSALLWQVQCHTQSLVERLEFLRRE